MDHTQPPRAEKCGRRRWRRRIILLAVVLAVATGLKLISPAFADEISHWLNVGAPLNEPVDCVFVLGGGADIRPIVAAEIVKAGLAEQVLIAAAKPTPGGLTTQMTEAEIAAGMLQAEGVPADMLTTLELPISSTKGEILALQTYLDSHDSESVAIVTHNFHTRRVRLMVARTMPDRLNQIRLVSCPTDGFGPENWWKYEAGLRTYWLEMVKYVVAWLTF